MKPILLITLLSCQFQSFGQSTSPDLKVLLNAVVGGIWVSDNEKNNGDPEDFKRFYMSFKNWADEESVIGDIYGIKNNGDTTQLMEVWNYIDKANKNIFLVQRTAWGETSVGTIVPYENKHLDIQFKSTLSDGRSYYTRDIHYLLDGFNEMKAETYYKAKEDDDWQKLSESVWLRK